MKKKVIIHVYYGTAGNNGLYIKQTLDALRQTGNDVKAFVNAYYLFDDKDCYKVFFKISEFMKRSFYRKYVKFLEMIFDFGVVRRKIQKIAKEYDEVQVVYSLNECYKPAYGFLNKLKKNPKIELGILVHDIVPFEVMYTKAIYVSQEDILSLADFYVAHNEYTSSVLREKYSGKKILQHRFPLLDLSELVDEKPVVDKGEEISFLFLGFLRKEKGVDVLLRAWEKVEKKHKNIKLIIAGKIPEGVTFDFSGCEKLVLMDKYLDDAEYAQLILNADYGVLPYTEGTNSGVLSTISCYRRPTIVSDLPMFRESTFTLSDLFFSAGDGESLAVLLDKVITEHTDKYEVYCREMERKICDYKQMFSEEVVKAYNGIVERETMYE